MLIEGGDKLKRELANFYNKCLEKQNIPVRWQLAEVVLIHKKGDINLLNN